MDYKGFLILLLFGCFTCLGDSLPLKGSEGRQIERIVFKPREKVVFQQKEANKEMLYGSVIWFKPKDGEAESNEVKDVVRLRSRKKNTYRRQNKSIDLMGEPTENGEKNDKNCEENNPKNNQESTTTRKSKSIDETKQEDGNKVVKEIIRIKNNQQNRRRNENREQDSNQNNSGIKSQIKGQDESKVAKAIEEDRVLEKTKEISTTEKSKGSTSINNDTDGKENNQTNNQESTTTRTSKSIDETKQEDGNTVVKEIIRIQNTQQNRRRNKNRKQNSNQNKEKSTDIPNSNNTKKDSHGSLSQNESIEETKTAITESTKKQVERVIDENDSRIKSQDESKEAKAIKEDRVLEKTKEITTTEKSEESTSINPTSKSEENISLTNSEKQKVVENADLLGLLLAQSDPSLVKVLIDNSSPENLKVFLSHSNITEEELRDIIAY